MKLQHLLLLLLVALFAACQGDDLISQEHAVPLSISTPTQSATRTALHDGTTVVWQQGDVIAVYDYQTPKRNFTAEIHETTTQFSGYISPRCGSFLAAYPYALAADNLSSQSLLFTLPSEQMAVQDGFAPGVNLSVARGERNVDGSPSQVRFRNVCQLFALSVPQYAAGRIARIQLSSAVGIAGSLSVDYSGANPEATLGAQAATAITLLPPTGEQTFAQGTYYIVAAPVPLMGFTLTLTDASGKTFSQSSRSTLGGEPGHIYHLGHVDLIETPQVSAAHVYQENQLVGTRLTLAPPVPDKAWSATVRNAQGTVVRTLPAATGELVSDHTDTQWPYLPTGAYSVDYTYTTANGRPMQASTQFQIMEQPRFSAALSAASNYSYYKGDGVERDLVWANQMDKNLVSGIALTLQGVAPAILANPNYTFSQTNSFGQPASRVQSLATSFQDITLSQVGEHALTAQVAFDGVSVQAERRVWITGLPFECNAQQMDTWTKSGAVNLDGDYLRFGNASGNNQSLTFGHVSIPAGTKVALDHHFVCKSGTVGTEFSILAGSQELVKGSSGSLYDEKTFRGTVRATLNANTVQIKCQNSYGLATTHARLYSLALKYSE